MYKMENISFINEAYISLLDRLPDNNGLNSHLSLLKKGRTRSDIVYSILSSDEFFNKIKNWAIVNRELNKILGKDVKILKNYQTILDYIADGKKLPVRQQDLVKIKSSKFALVDEFLIHFAIVILGVGVIIDIIDNRANFPGKVSDDENLQFLINDVPVIPTKCFHQFLLRAPVDKQSKIAIKYNNRIYYNDYVGEFNLNTDPNKISVAIVGRFEDVTSIGSLSLTFLRHLYGEFNCKLIDTRPDDSRWGYIDESYSSLQVKESEASGVDVAIYTDVFSNSLSDVNYKKIPPAQIKIAYVVFDSTRLPSWWVDSLNTSFDAVITTSKWGKKMIENSGVIIPVIFIPLSLDLSFYKTENLKRVSKRKFRFGSVSSFSFRKNIKQLVKCFIDCFGDSDDVELIIHAPLNYGHIYEETLELIKQHNVRNVIISSEVLSEYNYASLINSFDVYVLVSKGECYSITPRQAFALGKPAIISAGHAHDEMIESGLFIPIKVAGYEPAHYEAFNGQAIGLQCYYNNSDISNALRTAYFKYTEIISKSNERIEYAESFSHEQLKYFYINIVAPKIIFLGKTNEILKEGLSTTSKDLYRKYDNIRFLKSKYTPSLYKFQKIIVPVHDGGFFSVFNTFISHFVWNYGRPDVAAVIPDWRISTLRSYRFIVTPMSFCYGTEDDGNIFTKLFLPIPDMPIDISDYNNDLFLKSNAVYYDDFNEKNEPLLTYIHARELYRSANFSEWRQRYGRFYSKYFRINDSIRVQIDALLLDKFNSNYVIGVHIKHPSHAIEQPNGLMPNVSNFIKKILDIIEEKQIISYKIFLATDQDSAVLNFESIFGDRLICRANIARTSIDDDARYNSLEKEDQLREGHQIQNLLASDPSRWSIKMAEDVLIDAHLLASCNVFVHVTSNISTAVSFINPEIEMIYCE